MMNSYGQQILTPQELKSLDQSKKYGMNDNNKDFGPCAQL